MAFDKDAIIASLKEASILDLADLVKAIEDEFGVSAAAPVAAAGAAGDDAAAKDSFDVELTEPGQAKIDLTLTNLAVYRPGCGMALRKSIIDSTIEIFRRVKVDFNAVAQTHDQAAWLAAVARGTLYHLHQPLFIRRIHPDSTWQTEKKQHKDRSDV